MEKTFKGWKVIDLSTVLAGPSVGMFFAELGAEVIKIEHPKNGDVTRSWKLPNEDPESEVSAYFSSINYLKQYRKLDFSEEEGRKELFQLIADADVVLMNFKFGTQEKLGILDEVLFEKNPKLIIGKISGFGSNSDRVAYDLVLQAESGIMSMNGNDKSGPLKVPVAWIDVLAAHQLKQGLLIAILEKKSNKDFKGKVVTVSLYDAAVSSLLNQASNYLMTGNIPQRIGSLHPNIAPYGELFITKDGGLITFAIGSDKHFKLLCSFFRRPDIAENDKFSTVQERVKNRMELFQILQVFINQVEANVILEGMRALHVPCAKIKNVKEVFEDEKTHQLVRTEVIDGIETKRVTSIVFRFE